MSTTHDADIDERKVVTFTLDGQMFGIDMSALIEIREWEEPTPLPGVPSYIKGVVNLRGSVVPVVGLAERLGWTPSQIHSRSCVLVVSIGGKQCGFLIDQLADIVVINTADIQPAPTMDVADENVVAGLARIERRALENDDETEAMVLLLDIEALSLTRHLMDLAA
jgi:purine-binding chemotaxis protein CheW